MFRPVLIAMVLALATSPVAIVLKTAAAALPRERPITDEERDHWAFRPPKRPAPPDVRNREWARNPIDAFILAKLESHKLAPAPEASRATLLRRLSFDLIGLPPTPEEIHQFEHDDAPGAYERVVDRLLSSPQFGVRQARFWLDLARYADTDGFEFDKARPNAWRYRDWVVNAFNRDLPYDQFVRRQLAGDELAPDDPSAFIATGFNRCYPDMVDQNDQGLRRQNALNDITETTGLVFLGLTIGCARCHDHKFDPIRQTDFYRLQAFFAPARFRDDRPLGPLKSAGQSAAPKAPKSSAPAAQFAALCRALTARGLEETGTNAPPTYLLKRGEYTAKGPVVEPAFPAVLARSAPRIVPSRRSTGRRSSLARWLTRPDHPLTTRVIVNRLWQAHFGRGLVATTSDFGLMGEEPSHPELLDWLATELVARGWALKSVHRLIVTSATYRQASTSKSKKTASAALEDDPENRLLWRQNRQRLDGEAIRDALLAASGRLNRALGGPGVFPPLPPELARLSSKGAVWPVSNRAADRTRRSLYVFVRRNLRYPFFEAFDRPDTNASCPERPVTTIAQQALSLLNGPLSERCAQALADRVRRGPDAGPAARVERAYLIALGRRPDDQERALALEFLARGGPAFADFCLALFNVNEFVYID